MDEEDSQAQQTQTEASQDSPQPVSQQQNVETTPQQPLERTSPSKRRRWLLLTLVMAVIVALGITGYFVFGDGFLTLKSFNVVHVNSLIEYGEEFDCESIGSDQPFETQFPANGKSYKVTYCLGSIVGMTNDTEAVSDLSPYDFNLKVDIDGDGTIDESLEPAEIKIMRRHNISLIWSFF